MYERSYNNKVLRSDEKPGAKVFPWKRVLIVVGSVGLLTGIVFVIRAKGLQVRDVHIQGTHVADPGEVSQFVQGELEGRYLWVLPKTSIILVSPDTLELRIREHFPRFKSVSVARTSVRALTVEVQEYDGAYLWCDDACSFMDEKGIVFADAPYFSGSAYLKVYNGLRAPYPFEGLEEDSLELIRLIDDKLRAINIDPVVFRFENEHELAVFFHHNGHDAKLLFDPEADTDTALETIYTGLRTEPLQHLYHDAAQVLEYMDARFEGKLVYKFK